jgi:hypothetical protein
MIVTGLWICLVTALSSYAATFWYKQDANESPGEKLFGGLQSVQTNIISVPVIADGAVQGYVLAQFTFTIKSDVMKRMSVKPDIFLLDAAFRSIYSADAAELRGARKQDLQVMTAAIKSRVNERFGKDLVEDLLIEKFTFVPKDEVREGANLMKNKP